jgi:hypothetical protein
MAQVHKTKTIRLKFLNIIEDTNGAKPRVFAARWHFKLGNIVASLTRVIFELKIIVIEFLIFNRRKNI